MPAAPCAQSRGVNCRIKLKDIRSAAGDPANNGASCSTRRSTISARSVSDEARDRQIYGAIELH